MIEHEKSGPLDLLTWTFSRITMWAPAFIVTIIIYEVIMRYLFAAATLWVNEMSLWVGGAIYLTAGLYSMQQRSHIRIFILYDIAPTWLKKIFDVIVNIALIIFCIGVVYGSADKTINAFVTWELFGSAFNPPIPATMKPLILIMMIFLALQAMSNLIRDWPANNIIRKIFDLSVSAFIITLGLAGLNVMILNQPENFNVPIAWQIGIVIFLIISIGIIIYGLITDFNKVPIPFTEKEE